MLWRSANYAGREQDKTKNLHIELLKFQCELPNNFLDAGVYRLVVHVFHLWWFWLQEKKLYMKTLRNRLDQSGALKRPMFSHGP